MLARSSESPRAGDAGVHDGYSKSQREAAAKQARSLGLLKGTSIWQEPPTPSGQLSDTMLIAPPGVWPNVFYPVCCCASYAFCVQRCLSIRCTKTTIACWYVPGGVCHAGAGAYSHKPPLHTQGGAPLRILSFAEIRAQVEQTGGPLAEVPTRPSAQRHSSASSRRGGGARDGRKSAGSPHGVPGEARGALHTTNSSSSMKRRRRVRGTEQGSSSEAGRTGSPLPP